MPGGISLEQAAARFWDVVVIGAGPAGSLAARQSALSGLKTLLLDGKHFPRDKVCGGCVNARALEILHQRGLGQVVTQAEGVPLQHLQVVSDGRSLPLDLPQGIGLSRKLLDSQLVGEAIPAGVRFLPETLAAVEPECDERYRTVAISNQIESHRLQASIVVSAEGLLRSSLKQFPQFKSAVSPKSRMGAGALIDDNSENYPPGRITMAVSQAGYVGLTRVENNRLNIAAALDPRAVKAAQSLVELVQRILRDAGCPVPVGIEQGTWHGTPMLTSHPQTVAADRIFLIGDSAGYVEPFTGEGIANALESAVAVAPLVVEGVREWRPQLATDWARIHRECIGQRQWICRSLAALLRSPRSVKTVLRGCQWFPAIPRYFVSKINRPASMPNSVMTGFT